MARQRIHTTYKPVEGGALGRYGNVATCSLTPCTAGTVVLHADCAMLSMCLSLIIVLVVCSWSWRAHSCMGLSAGLVDCRRLSSRIYIKKGIN
jgi:hypothetical protein